jgi:putative DNA primase/helicase
MPYKTYDEQILEHVNYLQAKGLIIDEVALIAHLDPQVNDHKANRWQRCRWNGQKKEETKHKDGEGSYRSDFTKLKNGLCGIKTSCRVEGEFSSFNTYGSWPDGEEKSKLGAAKEGFINHDDEKERHEQAARKAYGFWQHCSPTGHSDYLDRKGIGPHGLRFHASEQFGCVAVVPMIDENGRLWSYQLLNNDGSKRIPKDARTDGLFHVLGKPIDGQLIGIAEGYATAATCAELGDLPVICAFSSENLPIVTALLLKLFSASPILIFADNDQHLVVRGFCNKGIEKALEAQKLDPTRIILAVPDFGNVAPAKEASDWNDLMRIRGRAVAEEQIRSKVLKQ